MLREAAESILSGTELERAIVYARVSGDDRKYSTSGIDGQLADCKKYAEGKGYNIVAEFYEEPDKATSGYDWLPELQKILALAERSSFDVLVVREIDRLARNRFKQMSVENHLESYGIRVEYVIGQYRDTAEGRLLKGLMGEFAEFEKNKIAERTVRGRVRAIKAGKIPKSALTYGYNIEDGEMTVNEYEAAMVQKIFDLYVNDNESLSRIAKWLDKNEVSKPAKRACNLANLDKENERGWIPAVICHILENETYAGRWNYRKTKKVKNPVTGKLKQLKRPREEWLTVKVPAIVEDDIFNRAQEIKDENKRLKGKNRKHEYLLGGMASCGHCGKSVIGKAVRKTQLYYTCSVRNNKGAFAGLTCDNRVVYRVDNVDNAVWEWIKSILLDKERREEAIKEYQETQRDSQVPTLRMIEANENKLTGLQAQKDRLIKAYREGVLGLDEIAKEKTSLDKQIAALKGAIEGLKNELSPNLLTDSEIESIHQIAEDFAAGVAVAESDFKLRRKLMRALRVEIILQLIEGERWVKARCVLGKKVLSVKSYTTKG